MKIKLFILSILFISSNYSYAQDNFDKDILRFLEINGSKQTMAPMVDQMVKQFRSMNSSVPNDFWTLLKLDLTADMTDLMKKMVPIYKKHLTHEEVKGLIEFYESPVGKSFTSKSGLIMQESMQIGQQWGMQIGGKIQQKLKDEGY
ncbi:MAG: hypothetical protein ACJA2S_004516 [Cyclobacteriaceae bacterium]|jgi:hypothetical protein